MAKKGSVCNHWDLLILSYVLPKKNLHLNPQSYVSLPGRIEHIQWGGGGQHFDGCPMKSSLNGHELIRSVIKLLLYVSIHTDLARLSVFR